MFLVWLTVTLRLLKSAYMNDSGLVGLALPRAAFELSMGLLFASSSPRVHGTVMAESVKPTPVIWSYPGPEAARACPGGPMATSAPSASAAAAAPAHRARDSTSPPAERRARLPIASPSVIGRSRPRSPRPHRISQTRGQAPAPLLPAPAGLSDNWRHHYKAEE